MDIFSEQLEIRFGNIDKSDTLTIASTFDFFQEAAISHAEILGVGRDAMKRTGLVWVLSRISVFMERRPRFGETVTVRSWPRGSYKLFAVRDYDIRDAKNKPVVRGRSGWLILGIEKRRPMRPQTGMDNLPLNEGVNALPAGGSGTPDNEVFPGLVSRFETSPPGLVRSVRKACYSDIDYNGHMNNTRYVQWIQDMLDPAVLENARQIRLDLNYLSEILPGEAIELCLLPLEGADNWPAETGGPEKPEETAVPDGYPAVPLAAFALEGRRSEPKNGESAFRAELRMGS